MNQYIKKLHWNISNEEFNEIKKCIDLDTSIDYNTFILPKEGKEYWENCAKILVQLDDGELIKLFPKILEWFQDLNWPGGNIVLDRINKMPGSIIEDFILQCIDEAILKNDIIWIEFLLWLDNIKTKKISLKILETINIKSKSDTKELVEWLKTLPHELKSKEITKLIKNENI